MKDIAPTVLLVDDEQLNLKLLKAHLSSCDVSILEATTGEKGLIEAEKGPHLILLDIMMPGMDGFETCRQLKAREETRDIPVIFLSALGDPETRIKCFEIGGVDYINKPFNSQEVLARVKTHIALSQRDLELKEYASRLEQMVEERTRQLIHADRLATLGTFSAGIAHEIRNPLTGINTYLYNLEDLCNTEDELDKEGTEMVKQIARQIQIGSNKIEAVIKKVLNFSKPIEPTKVLADINIPVGEAVKLAAVTLRKRGIEVIKSLGDEIPQSYTDIILIEQVILNLINNAANAMEKTDGTKKIEISSSIENGHVLIKVSDSGPGISPALRARIFDPFFTTDTHKGSGLGLNIAQRIITGHGGSLDVGTSKWGGAEFSIKLPLGDRSEFQ